VQDLRGEYQQASHARLPSTLAELRCAWAILIDFASETGTIGAAERRRLARRGIAAFEELGSAQTKFHQFRDPGECFLALLRSALSAGTAHVANAQGGVPGEPHKWGWLPKRNGKWVPQGVRVGWVRGYDLFLEPLTSHQVAQQSAHGNPLEISQQSLRHQLRLRGMLVATDACRQVLTVRRIFEGHPRQVLHLRASVIDPT